MPTLDENGEIVLADEVLTPDSSRFWPLEGYEVGKSQPSYDKQFVRDWLRANPDSDYKLPQDVIDKTIAKYKEAYTLLTARNCKNKCILFGRYRFIVGVALFVSVAQGTEHRSPKAGVGGSNPLWDTR